MACPSARPSSRSTCLARISGKRRDACCRTCEFTRDAQRRDRRARAVVARLDRRGARTRPMRPWRRATWDASTPTDSYVEGRRKGIAHHGVRPQRFAGMAGGGARGERRRSRRPRYSAKRGPRCAPCSSRAIPRSTTREIAAAVQRRTRACPITRASDRGCAPARRSRVDNGLATANGRVRRDARPRRATPPSMISTKSAIHDAVP